MEKIAFVGLGNMGGPMAKNLLSAGPSVNVFDLVNELARPLTEFGANVCETIEDTVADVDVVITMLPAGKHVKSVYLGDEASEGVFSLLKLAGIKASFKIIFLFESIFKSNLI